MSDLEQRPRPPVDSWIAAVFVGSPQEGPPAGAGVVIDRYRVLTCRHVVQQVIDNDAAGWVMFPKARVGRLEFAINRVRPAVREDVAVLELIDPVPPSVEPATLRAPSADDLVDEPWWAFGFPRDAPFGADAHGTIEAALGWEWVSLQTTSRHPVRQGFSGAGLWSPRYQAVVGLLGQVRMGGEQHGDALALTMRQVDVELPLENINVQFEWSLPAAGETAHAAWGWSLDLDDEAVRHWRPRARGVSVDSEAGYRFSGRAAALAEIVAWLERTSRDRRILVVTGSPGVGKSAVLGRVVTTADVGVRAALPSSDHNVKAPLGIVSCAIHAKGKTAMDVAVELASAASVRIPRDLDDLLPSIREELERRTPRRFNVVVDALDEAASPSHARAILTRLLLPLTQTCSDVGAQVVIGTRRRDDGGDLITALGAAASVIDLDDERYFLPDDLAAYALATLQLLGDERPDNPYEDSAAAEPLAWRIAEAADQNFLIAGLVARTHGMYDVEPVPPERLVFTPRPTVDAALADYLERITPVGQVPATEILVALAYAQATGLSIDIWRVVLSALGSGPMQREELERFAGSNAANFLVETSSDEGTRRYRLFHQALNDALLRTREQRGARLAEEREIARHLVIFGRNKGWEHADPYLLRALPTHASRADRIDLLLVDDEYLLHADLRRLTPLADRARTDLGLARARLLHLTPRAISAGPDDRVALFDVTQMMEGLGKRIAPTRPAPYRALWASVRRRTERSALEGHARRVNALCTLEVDDRVLLASASDDWSARIWDPASASQVFVLRGHTRPINALCAVSVQERQLLVTAGADRTVRMWDPLTGLQEWALSVDVEVTALCATGTAGGRTIVLGDAVGSLIMVDPSTAQRRTVLSFYGERVVSVFAAPCNGIDALVVNSEMTVRRGKAQDAHERCRLRIVDVRSAAVLTERHVTDRDRGIFSCGVPMRRKDGSTSDVLAIGVASGTIYLRNVYGREVGVIRGYTPKRKPDGSLEPEPDRSIVAMAKISDSQGRSQLVVAPTIGSVEMWNPSTGLLANRLATPEGQITAACSVMIDNRPFLATAGSDGVIQLWNPVNHHGSKETGTYSQVLVGTSTKNGSQIAAIRGKTVRLWETMTGHEIHRFQGVASDLTGLCTVQTRRAAILASSCRDGTIWLWDLDTGRTLYPLSAHAGPAIAICAITLRGEQLIATTHNSRSILLWDPVRRRRAGQGALASLRGLPSRLVGHTSNVRALAPVPINGVEGLASASEDTICLWNLRTGTVAATLDIPERHRVTSINYLRTGGRDILITSGGDNKVMLWDPQAKKPYLTLSGHTDTVTSLCTIVWRDRVLLASASLDRTVRLWAADEGIAELVIPVSHPAIACVNSAGYLIVGVTVGVIAIDLAPFGNATTTVR